MTTSGTSTFSATRNDIIRTAALLIKAVNANSTMSARMVTDFDHALNAMVKRWQARDLHVWTTSEATLFPVAGQTRYSAGTGATDHITGTYYSTTISADEASGQTILSVTSTANMTAADHIGIVLDDGTLFWTTIVSKTSSTVTITDALTDSAATGNYVFNYTSRIVQPLRITDARRYNIDSDTDTPVSVISRYDYQNIPLKNSAGTINQIHYNRQLGTGYIHVWQVPSTATELLKFTWRRPIMDFNAATDNPDLPHEWIQTLEYNLALVMAPQYQVDGESFRRLKMMADEFLDDMKGLDRDDESVFFQPSTEY